MVDWVIYIHWGTCSWHRAFSLPDARLHAEGEVQFVHRNPNAEIADMQNHCWIMHPSIQVGLRRLARSIVSRHTVVVRQ